MSSLRDNFAELLTRIQHGREFGHASFEPIYYLVFPPQQILEVKRQLPAWMARLHNEGWDVTVFSMAEAIADILGQAPLRQDLAHRRSQRPAGVGQDESLARQCPGPRGTASATRSGPGATGRPS